MKRPWENAEDGYNPKSCNALEKPFYRPVEAAIRWCGLIAHEAQILMHIGEDGIPKTGQFPQWPCLQANTEKILDAIMHGNIPHGRDGRTVAENDHVAKARLTVRHTDLREWMAKHYPDQKPAFLFDEIERKTHAAINADAFQALQVDRDVARAELEQAKAWAAKTISEMDAMRGERDSLRAMVDKMTPTYGNAQAITGLGFSRLQEAIRAFDPKNPPRSKKAFMGTLEKLRCDTREQEVFANIAAEHFGHNWRS